MPEQLTAKKKEREDNTRYSYGWHRAEIVAALVNGVFLLALCFSIFLDAIQRFFSKQSALKVFPNLLANAKIDVESNNESHADRDCRLSWAGIEFVWPFPFPR